ncbi:hypothetical protein H3C65_02785 [Patescibacteria group bacterium]|nr:hypothetical protein [Patescibacteria group bacterium]
MIKIRVPKIKAKIVGYVVLSALVIYALWKMISNSVFLKGEERVNVVFFSENTAFFSLSKKDVNYLFEFTPEVELLVPGGYGQYKLGGLGKLVSLEKKPDLFRKTFSVATSSFVDLYFYPRKTDIYYSNNSQSFFPKISDILFSKSNANIVDRLILVTKLFDRNRSEYKIVTNLPLPFSHEEFYKDFQGSFYKTSYREKMTTVQILYQKSYSTALLLSHLIEGEGIRVVDLSEDENIESRCRVISKSNDFIVEALASFFRCRVEKGKTDVSDIIIKLGNLEKDWAVK